MLVATIGLPYFLLSTTSPLVQAWFARANPGASPYRLFALSNLASMLALVGYPFLLEPWAPTREQAIGWSAGYALFVVLCAAAGWRSLRHAGYAEDQRAARPRGRGPRDRPRRAGADAVAAAAVVRAGGDRLAAAAGGVQPHHAEHRVGAAAVDRCRSRSTC